MSGLVYRVDVGPVEASFAAAQSRLDDMTGVNHAVGEVLVNALRRNIDTSGDGKWPPLSPATLIARARAAGGKLTKRAKGGKKTLTVGAVRAMGSAKALIRSAAGLYALIAYQAFPNFVEAGSNLIYAAHQFFGSKPEWVWHIPARNPLYLHDTDEVEIRRMYLEWLTEPFA